MTESDGTPHPGKAAPAEGPKYADHVFRSNTGVVTGALLLALGAWLVIDAVIHGTGRTPWVALAAALLCAGPVVAFTVRPSVRAGRQRIVVRNPLRTITVPWASVEGVRARYSAELTAEGRTFQLWAVPVSLRARNKANRQAAKAAAVRKNAEPGKWAYQQPPATRHAVAGAPDPTRAWSDQVVGLLQRSAEQNALLPEAKGEIAVTWCWWVIAPTVAGAVALAALLAG
ncbi:PH domain-containing protein [Kitasatospora sp. NPDC052896]|uniref:PH domain-containing protein n=1 Tax=Kitasatospora sp. NPDC052896 TaxID=3364061 RepID=UPI0037C6A170